TGRTPRHDITMSLSLSSRVREQAVPIWKRPAAVDDQRARSRHLTTQPRLLRTASRARAAKDDVVPGDGVAAALLHVAAHGREAVVGECLDFPAPVADEMVVVILVGSGRLEPGDAVADVHALEQA